MDYGEWTPDKRSGYNKWDAISRSTTQVHQFCKCLHIPTRVKLCILHTAALLNILKKITEKNLDFVTLNRYSLEAGLQS
jgi:hypothetical protein